MSALRIAPLQGVGRLTPKYRHMAETLHGPGFRRTVTQIADEAVYVDGLARLLDRAWDHAMSVDGRLDLRAMAMFMIAAMRPDAAPRKVPATFEGTVEQMANDAAFLDDFSTLLDRALEHGHSPDGRLDLREAAMFMIKKMRSTQR